MKLLIWHLGGSCYGLDVEQIAKLADKDTVQPAAVVSLASLLGITVNNRQAGYSQEKLLLLKGRKIPILIPEPEEIATSEIAALRSLPAIFLPTAGVFGIWALWPRADGLIILLDFHKNQLLQKI